MRFCDANLGMSRPSRRKTRDELGMKVPVEPRTGLNPPQKSCSDRVSEGGLEPPRPCGH